MTQLTKEEAIKKLNVIKEYLTAGNPIWDVREIDEALDMAIKALEELPKRRKEAKRWKCKALQAELVKHGEWIEIGKNKDREKRGRRMTREALSYAQISVEVLNDHCWQDCEDFEPWLHNSTYATNLGVTCIYSRHFQCKNMNKCKQISLHLERSGDTE